MQKPTENDYIGDSLVILKTVTYDVATIVNDETKKLRQEVLELKRQLRLEQERTSKMEIRSFEMVHDLIKRNEAVPLKCPDGGEHKWVLSHSRLESRPFAELNKIAFHECMKCGNWGKHASIIEKIKEKE